MNRRSLLLALPSLAAGVAQAASAELSFDRVASGDAMIAVRSLGSGPAVVMVPSVGRSTQDFNDLAYRVAKAGFRVVLPEPRGTAGSTGLRDDLSLEDYGRDLIAVMDHLKIEKAVMLGHAAGARDARMAISLAPSRVTRLVSIATGAGGEALMRADINRVRGREAHEQAAAPGRFPDSVRLDALKLLYFAPSNDASVWLPGWWPQAYAAHGAASRKTPRQAWWPGRPIPSLIIEALDDAVAPPQGAALVGLLGPETVVVSLPNAGHAMLPEQPEAIATVVVAYLRGRTTGLQALVDARARPAAKTSAKTG